MRIVESKSNKMGATGGAGIVFAKYNRTESLPGYLSKLDFDNSNIYIYICI
jgi:hypothetical protein